MQGTSNASGQLNAVSEATNKRYDRQIRIWGAHGQTLLQAARICMLGAGPVATETLKNLVLGGIASFTVVDNGVVTERDLGNNFFFNAESSGCSRAETATQLVRELNESVKGSFSDLSISELLGSTNNFFADFNLVIATEVCIAACAVLSSSCHTQAASKIYGWPIGTARVESGRSFASVRRCRHVSQQGLCRSR